ncbi:MAG: FAD-dependent oxidoreductase, partial [Armatimonadetes bacterium]|nr:FAD-dependent oxidoreductase [Armatimonadota bacterium]
RCLYSRNISNLMMAGRDISVSHVALGSTRLIATCGAEGQAAGTAAALCKKYYCFPRDIYRRHIRELQYLLLRDDAHLLNFPLREEDNLAQRATVTASSFADAVPFDRAAVRPSKAHECDSHDRAVRIPWRGGRLTGAWALLENRTERPVEIQLQLRVAESAHQMSVAEPAAVATASAASGRNWVRFDFDIDCGSAKTLWFVVPATRGVSWWLTDVAPTGASRAWSPAGKNEWHEVGEVYALCTEPAVSILEDCRPEKVADGFSRPNGPDYCGWMSAPGQKLPQRIELRWPQPHTVAQVEIVFDTNLDARWPRQLYEPEVVRDYAIEYLGADGAWQRLIRVTDNYARFRVHRFSPVQTSAVRITVIRTGGAPEARIFEVRVYEQPGP